jgi:hypothetical protein
MTTVYQSKIDPWLLLVFFLVIILSGSACVAAMIAGGNSMWITIAFTGSIGIGLPIWLLFSTDYTLDCDVLAIRSGPFRWKVPVHEIENITPTSSPLSSPALSLDRLRIEYGAGRSIMISPLEEEEFLVDIEARRNSAEWRRNE